MDYKEIVRDAKVMAESFRQDGNVYLPNRNGAARTIKRVLREIPAADVAPVVRCRECRNYRETRTKRYGNLICRCTRMGKHDMDYPVKPDDFCSYGER